MSEDPAPTTNPPETPENSQKSELRPEIIAAGNIPFQECEIGRLSSDRFDTSEKISKILGICVGFQWFAGRDRASGAVQ